MALSTISIVWTMTVLSSPAQQGTPNTNMDTQLNVDASAPGLRFDGHGGLSAGASSRLLYDYDPDVRSDILDYLYKPNFGANLHICKVEIGGDTQSTDGTEPSHMHTRDDLNCTRGYEFWLMKEAKKRNPDVVTYGLPWGAPGWINNQTGYYGPDMITYQVNWLKCAKEFHDIDVDYFGLWNERPWGTADYVKTLRKAISSLGMTTQLVLGDGGMPDIWDSFGSDAQFTDSFAGVGLHYPCEASHLGGHGPALITANKTVWASEDWWSEAEFPGGACWAKLFNQNFIRMNMTATISWSTIWSVYPVVDVFEGNGDSLSGDGFWGPGLVYAWQPWSGHYVVPPTVWASAHTNQFAKPGWKMLFSAAGNLAGGGSYVTMVSPDMSDFSTIIETAHADCHHCSYAPSTASTAVQTLTITLRGELAKHTTLTLWHTDPTVSFVNLGDMQVKNSQVQLSIQPESMYTLTSTTGQMKGKASKPAPSSSFPKTWNDNFETYPEEGLARFWADQCGSFQVMPETAFSLSHTSSNSGLMQRVVELPGVNQWAGNLKSPLTVLGDWNRTDSIIGVRVNVMSSGGDVMSNGDLLLAEERSIQELFVKNTVNNSFKYQPGRIDGGAWETSKTFTSLVEAETFCISQQYCNGITFESTNKVPVGSQLYWFTSLTVVGASPAWQTYLLDTPRPSPPSPPSPTPVVTLGGAWGGVCTRVSKAGGGDTDGFCLQVNKTHWQAIDIPGGVLGQGVLPKAQTNGGWRNLNVNTTGTTVVCGVDDTIVGTFVSTKQRGMFGLMSGWNLAMFDEFTST